MIDPGLQGRVVLVTGANNPQGIGAAIARAFAAQGAHLFLHYYRPQGMEEAHPDGERSQTGEAFYAAQQTRDIAPLLVELQVYGVRAAALEADLAAPEAVPALFTAVEKAVGPVEVLVNNAAYWEADTFVPAQAPLGSLASSASPSMPLRRGRSRPAGARPSWKPPLYRPSPLAA